MGVIFYYTLFFCAHSAVTQGKSVEGHAGRAEGSKSTKNPTTLFLRVTGSKNAGTCAERRRGIESWKKGKCKKKMATDCLTRVMAENGELVLAFHRAHDGSGPHSSTLERVRRGMHLPFPCPPLRSLLCHVPRKLPPSASRGRSLPGPPLLSAHACTAFARSLADAKGWGC